MEFTFASGLGDGWCQVPPIDSRDMPPGSASMPVKLVDNGLDGKVFETSLIAGSVGMRYTASGDCGDGGLDSLQPVAGWWMFIDKDVPGTLHGVTI